MGNKLTWSEIDSAPKSGNPFWMGTASGGVMLEAWHWCSERLDFAGTFSGTTLAQIRAKAPMERFMYSEMIPPRNVK